MIKLYNTPDWYTWVNPDLDWCRAYADLPGVRFEAEQGKMVVRYHISHVPCLIDGAQVDHNLVEQSRQQQALLPFEDSGLLRSYQQADLQFLKLRKGALLAYEMRVGKTPTACHLHNPNDGILMVCGPLAARESWRDWIDKVIGYPPWCLTGKTNLEAPPDCPAYFCHYDVLDAHTKFLATRRIGTLVLDECHMLQSRGTQRLTAVNVLAFRARKILQLTGTPCWNKPKSLWTLLHLATPGAWGSEFAFRRRYCDAQPGAHGWSYVGQSNADELKARLETIMVRRTWAEVAPELPATTRVIEPVEISGAEYAKLESASMKLTLARGTSNASGYLATLRKRLTAVKIRPACQIAERAALDGHKVVLWVWHNEIGERLTAALSTAWPAFRLQSSDSGLKRESVIDAFRQVGGPAFLVASMGVGGVGLDLSCSDYAIFVELDWTPAVVQQAEMRTFHMSRPHVVVYLHADDPIETKLIAALDVKNGFANALGLGSGDIERAVLST
jgi:SWI/SNF-related matrix-associated actin-dependent regulator of chromatin subfamily A-like protein 1